MIGPEKEGSGRSCLYCFFARRSRLNLFSFLSNNSTWAPGVAQRLETAWSRCVKAGAGPSPILVRPQWMTPIIDDIPFMHDALASIGVQGYTQVLFGVELKTKK